MGMTLYNAPKPWRGFPSMNVVHGIRLMYRVGGPGVALPRGSPKGKAIPIGTIPAGAFVRSVITYVKTGYTAGFTIDIGGNPNAASPPVFAYDFGTGIDISAAATLPQTLTFGFVPDDVEIYARLNGAGAPAAGEFDTVIQFYINKT